MTSIQDINSTIMFGDFSNEQLDSIVMAIKYRRNLIIKSVRKNIVPGDKVQWRSARHPNGTHGRVEKIGRKFVTVNSGMTRWRVPANMIEVI